MRKVHAFTATVIIGLAAATLGHSPSVAGCSVFSRHPCTPTFCSVFRRGPCLPDYEFWIGQDLRLTVKSTDTPQPASPGADFSDPSDDALYSIGDMFAALRGCWIPPDEDAARSGMQMTVRFAFKRNGDIVAPPRVTYTSPDASPELKETYQHAITAALERCTPLQFSAGLGNAVAGRPIAVRFVDDRTIPDKQP